MNLIIDIGNTQTKYAIFNGKEMLEFCESHISDLDLIKVWQEKYPDLDAAIVSSVQGRPDAFLKSLESEVDNLIFFDQNTLTPLENLYESKETLGYDRLAACVGANALSPNANLLVIDAGTAITFDFVSAENQYLGGTISPGLAMRFKALHTFTKKLPLLEKSETYALLGKNTSQAIISGVQNSLLFEIDSYINQLKQKHSEAKIFLTGGDSEFIHSKLKHVTFCDRSLLLYGLNAILNYNKS
ncbi:type III pantothenate kinase [Ancylomarina salipaludis]|uniref:Type III pantothenate kinase n=1 Tax=Ancylomarina salipaludis TaxID=2501299 RepID=A0A4Q1JK67_9BACT|nr:type III pantothenate kinase [Ancylomarina salipaludis]RXQ89888.1 type III pantothenate kinase [Ancylomarina salipaludis]